MHLERETVPSCWTQESREEVALRNFERAARAESVGTERSRLSRVTPCGRGNRGGGEGGRGLGMG